MAMSPPDRSKQLHNFSMPCLKWGNQRVLRCVKVVDHHQHNQRSSSSNPNGFQSKPTSLDPSKNNKPYPIQNPSSVLEDERAVIDDPSRPWNLRTRRAACKAPLRVEEKTNTPPRRVSEIVSPGMKENWVDKRQSVETMKKRVKFSVSLAKQEIEEDFMKIARIRPPRRPKKRSRMVQKYLDSIFPGLWLTEVTADSYKVPEVPES
ncbi:hypothetical protein K2173_026400 [Erythroxylum novogranatense]|uniref:DUF1639 family protein n=1 Tax=Erythroxylum novogranatense TaxID=1862640 RepID=A0AAV8SP13_9ROSI|nr:hypothetical protein K2173_026400 [Erythroxylum novogranatense]